MAPGSSFPTTTPTTTATRSRSGACWRSRAPSSRSPTCATQQPDERDREALEEKQAEELLDARRRGDRRTRRPRATSSSTPRPATACCELAEREQRRRGRVRVRVPDRGRLRDPGHLRAAAAERRPDRGRHRARRPALARLGSSVERSACSRARRRRRRRGDGASARRARSARRSPTGRGPRRPAGRRLARGRRPKGASSSAPSAEYAIETATGPVLAVPRRTPVPSPSPRCRAAEAATHLTFASAPADAGALGSGPWPRSGRRINDLPTARRDRRGEVARPAGEAKPARQGRGGSRRDRPAPPAQARRRAAPRSPGRRAPRAPGPLRTATAARGRCSLDHQDRDHYVPACCGVAPASNAVAAARSRARNATHSTVWTSSCSTSGATTLCPAGVSARTATDVACVWAR